jgi:hypothetical protein
MVVTMPKTTAVGPLGLRYSFGMRIARATPRADFFESMIRVVGSPI